MNVETSSSPNPIPVPPREQGTFEVAYVCPKCGPFSVYHAKKDSRNVWCQWCRSIVKEDGATVVVAPTPELAPESI